MAALAKKKTIIKKEPGEKSNRVAEKAGQADKASDYELV